MIPISEVWLWNGTGKPLSARLRRFGANDASGSTVGIWIGSGDGILAFPPHYGLEDGSRFELATETVEAVTWLPQAFIYRASATVAQVCEATISAGILEIRATGTDRALSPPLD